MVDSDVYNNLAFNLGSGCFFIIAILQKEMWGPDDRYDMWPFLEFKHCGYLLEYLDFDIWPFDF